MFKLNNMGRLLLAACAVASFGTQAAHAAWPDRPVRIIVPFAPGGTSDTVTRRMAQELGKQLGQTFVVENKAGAMGTIGMADAARSRPDGYTLVANDTGIVMLPHLRKSLPYDTKKDFTPVGAYVFSPFGLVVNASSDTKTLPDLIDKAKANPGKITYGSGGVGTSPHLAAEAFANATGTQLMHVPFKGAGEAIMAVAGKTIDMQLVTPSTAIGNLKSGRLKMLAVTGDQRLASLPDVPTFAEAGVKDFAVWNWIGLWAPAGTPRPVVDKLSHAIQGAMQTEDMKKFAVDMSAQPQAVVGDEFVNLLDTTDRQWKAVIDKAGLKPQ